MLVDPKTVEGFAEDAENCLTLVRVQPGQPVTYHAGSAWYRGDDVPDLAAWQAQVAKEKPAFRTGCPATGRVA